MKESESTPPAPEPCYAHTAADDSGRSLPQEYWQLLAEHLLNVASAAGEFATPFGAREEAFVAGLLHDLGKYQSGFQEYLKKGSPRTPHAVHGAAFLSRFPRLANVVAGHHAGLFDEDDNYRASLNELRRNEQGMALLRELYAAFQQDGLAIGSVPASEELLPVAEALRLRLLLSALADADFLDTSEHFLEAKGMRRPEPKYKTIGELFEDIVALQEKYASYPSPSSLNRLRTRIAEQCLMSGYEESAGVFSLSVPTGGGKTLASAAFALSHARALGFKRVIYVIPYTSIIEQNVRVFESVFGAENVLEHHSLADWRMQDDDENALDTPAARARLASENWDAPFIVTTNVQFFESLHGYRPSAVRKLHRLLDSVVLFDECQTFPPELLDPSLATLQALIEYGRTSLVFCTATQPAFERRPFFDEGFERIREIIPGEESWRLHEREEFDRVRIRFCEDEIELEEFADRIVASRRALAIVNTRRSARELFDAVQSRSSDEHVYHLSTYMCPAHRQEVLDEIRSRLETPDAPCLVISTQLIEAGVDLDFPKVFRVLGPLDAILQAAGRCNREGELKDSEGGLVKGEVEVVNLAGVSLPQGVYSRATALAAKYLPGEGSISPESIRSYFKELYHDTDRDKHGIVGKCERRLYRTIGKKYKWIDEDEPSQAVLVRYNEEAEAWLATFEAKGYEPLTAYERRATARLSINLRASEVTKGESSGHLRKLDCGVCVTQLSYDSQFGYNSQGVLLDDHSIY